MHGALGLSEEEVNAIVDVPLDTVSLVSTLLEERRANQLLRGYITGGDGKYDSHLGVGRKTALPHFNVKPVKHDSAAEKVAKKRLVMDHRRKSVEYVI